jgi:serine/threonine-protein kinase HipA
MMAAFKNLRVYLDGVHIGELRQSPQGALSFTYDDAYRIDPDATPLSMSMPLASAEHRNKPVRAYLDGLLPDSQAARARWAQQFNVSANNSFALLSHVGRDAAGAVQVLPPDVDPGDALSRDGDIEWLTDQDFARLSLDLAENGDNWDPGRFGGRWSLSGAQPKIALFRDPATLQWGIPRDSTPTTYVVKPAIEGFAEHHVNEALCLTAAREVGLLAARAELVEVANVQAVISHRYDRRQDSNGRWLRVHQEDLCQALAVHPSQKYQSDGGPGIAEIAGLLGRLPIDDRLISAERIFKALVFNVLIGGTDAHAKNFSMLLIGPRAQAAPLYDVASAACYPQYQRLMSPMKIGDAWKMLDVTDRDWIKVARRFGIPSDRALSWVEDLRAQLPAAFGRAVESLPTDVESVASGMGDRILEHVQRTWRPGLERDPALVLRDTAPARGQNQRKEG